MLQMPQIGHYANKCPEIKAGRRDRLKFEKWMGITKDDAETKSIRKTRVRYSDLESETKDPYIRFWVILLEIESTKKFILQYKRYSQKCPRQLLRSMQQFVLGDTWISSVAKTEWNLWNLRVTNSLRLCSESIKPTPVNGAS